MQITMMIRKKNFYLPLMCCKGILNAYDAKNDLYFAEGFKIPISISFLTKKFITNFETLTYQFI
jgi:hypothetical protein